MIRFSDIIGFSIGLAVTTTMTAADSITLRTAAVCSPRAKSIHLEDVAILEGPEAQAWARLPVAETTGDILRISITDIRQRLDEAGVHWGRVDLHGGSVRVRPAKAVSAGAPEAMVPMTVKRSAVPVAGTAGARSAVEATGVETLRAAVMRFLVGTLDTTPDSLRIVFDATDDSWLDTTVGETRYEIRALSDMRMSDRLDLEIRRWAEGRPGEWRLLKVKPLIRCTVAEAAANLSRHATILPEQVNAVEAWLTPSQRSIRLAPVDVIGQMPVAPVRVGTMFRGRDIRAVKLVDRGDPIMVRCLVGGAAISLKARAESSGGLGETIELRRGRDRETFSATITGPGEAVIDLDVQSRPSGLLVEHPTVDRGA